MENIILGSDQVELLKRMVEAYRAVPREKREKFLLAKHMQGAYLVHSGLSNGGTSIYSGDLDMLSQEGLILKTLSSRGGNIYDVTPKGFKYYSFINSCEGKHTESVEQYVHKYIDGDMFRRTFPKTFKKWSEACILVWSENNDIKLSVIGHLCRECVQEFIDEAIAIHSIDAPFPEKTKTKERLELIWNHKRKSPARQCVTI